MKNIIKSSITVDDISYIENKESLDQLIHLSINEKFSHTPGPRYKKQGPNSAEEFFSEVLDDTVELARNKNKKIIIDCDNVDGYMVSFVEEISGGLFRQYHLKSIDEFLNLFTYKAIQFSWVLPKFVNHINNEIKRLKIV